MKVFVNKAVFLLKVTVYNKVLSYSEVKSTLCFRSGPFSASGSGGVDLFTSVSL